MRRAELEGRGIGPHGCRWYPHDIPIETAEPLCPVDDCMARMEPTGWVWPTGSPGIHYRCQNPSCGLVWAVRRDQFVNVPSDGNMTDHPKNDWRNT